MAEHGALLVAMLFLSLLLFKGLVLFDGKSAMIAAVAALPFQCCYCAF